MTEILIYKPSVIKNGFFNDYSTVSWSQAGSAGSYTLDDGYAEHNSDGFAILMQQGVLRPTTKYRIKFKITDITASEFVTVNAGTAQEFIYADGAYSIELTSDGEDFSFICSAAFGGKISNVIVVEAPGSYNLDSVDAINIPITYSIDDIKNPEKRSTSYSKTITLPGTKNNNNIFSEIYEISGDSEFNPNKQCRCVVLNDGIEVFKGVLCLDNIVRTNGAGTSYDEIAYEVTLIGTLGNIFSFWGNKNVRELDFSRYNHNFDTNFIIGSWRGYIYTSDSGYLQNLTYTYTSPAITALYSTTFNGQDRVVIDFGTTHTFNIGDEVFVVSDDNNMLGGMQTVVNVSTNTITLNLFYSVLTNTSTPINGVVYKYEMGGFGYAYPMIDMATVNGETHELASLTNATLEVGKNYIIKDYVGPDNFVNVGGPSGSELGSQFIATGTTPTTWSNGSVLVSADPANWRVQEFYPAIYLKEVIDKSFELAGYNYDCPFFNTNQFKRLIIPFSNGEDFNMSNAAQGQLVFRASMQDTVTEPTGHTFVSRYNLYPYPNIVPFNAAASTFFPVHIDYTTLFPASTYVVASHHRILQNTGGGAPAPTGVIPFNNDQPPIDYDFGNNYDAITLYEYTQPSGYPALEYIFSFSGQCWNYIENPTVYDATTNPTGDLPTDYAGTGAPGIYATPGNNGKYFGSVTVPLPASAPVYDERTDVSFRPYNAIIFQKSTNGGASWTSIKALSANGLANGSYSEEYWNNTLVKGTADISLAAGDRVRCIFLASAKCTALRTDGHPCVGASAGGAAGTGFAVNGTGGPVRFTVKVENAIFSNKLKSTTIREGLGFDFNSVLPNVKISDIFLSTIKMFNLLVETDKSDDKLLRISPRDDFYSNTVIDWTDKLDIKNLSIKPMGELNARNYIYTYKEDKDYYGLKYKADWGGFSERIFGDRRFLVDNDFVTDTSTTQLIFNPTPAVGPDVAYRSADRVISTGYTIDNNGLVKKLQSLKLLMYNIRGTDIPWNLCSSSGNFLFGNFNDVQWYDSNGFHFKMYPQALHLDNHLTPNWDLNFDIPLATYYSADIYTDNNLFNMFHKKFIDEITDRNSRTVTAMLNLKPKDIAQLEFRNLILLDGHLLRLKKIVEYDVNNTGLTKCEFIKVKTRE